MLADKLQEFYDALVAIKTALVAKGVVVSKFTLDLIAGLVGQIQTQRNMGSKSVEFKQNAIVYGVRIVENEQDPVKRVVYTDDAVGMVPATVSETTGVASYSTWKKAWIFDKIKPCMLKSSGEVDYYLNTSNQTLKANGGSSDVSNIDYDGNAMVEFGRFYSKFSMDGEDECLQICNIQLSGFEPIGFIREDGSVADNFYQPMFLGTLDENNKLRSIANQQIRPGQSLDDYRKSAKLINSNYDVEVYMMNQVFQILYFAIFKRCDIWNAFGKAGRNWNVETKTGQSIDKECIFRNPTNNVVKFLWFEDFITDSSTSGLKRYEVGLVLNYNKIYVRTKQPYVFTDITSNYSVVGGHITSGGVSKYIKKMKCDNRFGRYPVEYNDTFGKYECSQWWTPNNVGPYASVYGSSCYFSGRHIGQHDSGSGSRVAALTYLPPA